MRSGAKKTELVPGTLDMLVEECSLYPALQRLALKGWVKSEWGPSENNRRARYYKLTPAGRKRLKQEVAGFERVLEAIMRVVQLA
jgi:DNA-binding PadR family transcriptional regulator